MIDKRLTELSKALKRRGFDVHLCENGAQAVETVFGIVEKCAPVDSIGFGNSMTVRSLGLYDTLSKFAKEIYIHQPVGTADLDRKALVSDFYFTSANAVSLDGQIVNIDGTGNRVAATCFGPKRVIYIIGRNKIADDLSGALSRAKEAAVKVAGFYNRKTPCVVTGKCEDCVAAECVCAVTTIHRKNQRGLDITVVLVDEELGI